MAVRFSGARKYVVAFTAAGLAMGMAPIEAAAQSDARLERIEQQLRALQRAVFPGGDQRFFEPEITPETAPAQQQPQAGTPSAGVLTDLLSRLDAIESQLARLTAATEVNENALSQLETRFAELEGSIQALEDTAERLEARPSGLIDVPGSNPPAGQGSPPAASQELPAVEESAGPSPERLAAVQAIAKPATGDAGDDEYSYGFRLWDAGFYPEAQQQLASFVEQYPDHWRTTYGRNLLGRAYLDAGDPRRAATHFFENYQDDKQAARAPDSLLYLAEAMIELGDTNRACIALAEFGDTYPALATGRLQEQYESNRSRVDCS